MFTSLPGTAYNICSAKNSCRLPRLNQKKTATFLFIVSPWHSMLMHAYEISYCYQNKASLCFLGNTCIRLGMLGGKGQTLVGNWNVIMYELTWLEGWGAWGEAGGVGGGAWLKGEYYPVMCGCSFVSVDIPGVIKHEWVHAESFMAMEKE